MEFNIAFFEGNKNNKENYDINSIDQYISEIKKLKLPHHDKYKIVNGVMKQIEDNSFFKKTQDPKHFIKRLAAYDKLEAYNQTHSPNRLILNYK